MDAREFLRVPKTEKRENNSHGKENRNAGTGIERDKRTA